LKSPARDFPAAHLTSDEDGKFVAHDLKTELSLHVSKEGVQPVDNTELQGTAGLFIDVALHRETTRQSTTRPRPTPNSIPSTGSCVRISGPPATAATQFHHATDVGTFRFKSGTITFLDSVNAWKKRSSVPGQGHFTFKAVMPLDTQEDDPAIRSAIAEEGLPEIVFRFSSTLVRAFSKIKITPTPPRRRGGRTEFCGVEEKQDAPSP